MALKWREDLPADWDAVPEQPPHEESDSVIEAHGNGVIMVPLQASMEADATQSYIYCERSHVTSLGETIA